MMLFWVVLSLIAAGLIVALVYLRRYKKRYEEKAARNRQLLVQNIELNTAHTLLRESFEQEKELISKTLHDEVGNSLASMRLIVDALGRTRHAGDFDLLITMEKELDRSLYVVRNITKDVYPHGLREHGLGFAIKELCERSSNPKLTKINFEEKGKPDRLPRARELVLYRAIQELIGNALKHSNSWYVNVTLEWSAIDLIVAVADNGLSHSYWQKHKGGIGLKSIRSSLKMIDASLFIDRERFGFKAEIIYPLYHGAYQDMHS
ncbi:MAG: hypothetical protein RIA63_13815 [Cyclobacteriaceae bacterium]